jgi:hypothetical protein
MVQVFAKNITKLLSTVFTIMEISKSFAFLHICEVIMERSGFLYVEVITLL